MQDPDFLQGLKMIIVPETSYFRHYNAIASRRKITLESYWDNPNATKIMRDS